MNRKWSVMLACTAALLLSGVIAMAQTVTASVRGTISDQSGAVLPGAKITVTNVSTGVAVHTVTDKRGLYNVGFLGLGDYTVTATAPGFESTTTSPFHLQIDQIATIDEKLKVGATSTSVKVSSGAGAILDTDNATLGTSISANTLQNLPLDGLNANFATMFTPGAVNPTVGAMGGLLGSSSGQNANTGYIQASAIPSYDGNRQQANNYVLDGIEINEPVANTLAYNESPFAIQEERVITADADAEYGNVDGAEVVIVTKSGTNKYHGSAFEYFQNQNLADNTFGNKYDGVAKSLFTQNQYGGAVGGPILRHKLFFFADYEGLRYTIPPSQTAFSVPDALEREGNFSELQTIEGITLYNTGVTAANPTGGTANATPYPNNTIPVLNPVATYLFAHTNAYPLPNHTAEPNTVTRGNYIGYSSSMTGKNQADGRLDYTINENNKLFAKFSYSDVYDSQQTVIPVIFPVTDNYPFWNAVVDWVHTFSPSWVNEARAGFTRIVNDVGIVSDPSGIFGFHGNSLVDIPLPNNEAQPLPGFTYQDFTGEDENQSFGTNYNDGTYTTDNDFYYGDDVTWQHGNHVTRFGVEILRYQNDYFNPSNIGGLLGQFTYDGIYTSAGSSPGFDYADFELDDSTGAQISGQSGLFGQRQYRDAYYVQDDWKVRPNLSVNLGLRYEYDQPLYEANNKMVSVNLAKALFNPSAPLTSLLEFAGKDGNSRALYNPFYLGFMPRLGFAYSVTPKVVLRGGYGVTDFLEGTGNGLRMTQNAPFQTSFTISSGTPLPNSPGTPVHVVNGFSNGSSPTTGTQYDVWAPNLKPAIVQQFNLTTQYLINDSTSAQLGYVGEIGQHLAVPVQANQFIAPCAGGQNGAPSCLEVNAPYYSVVGGGNLIETVSEGVENYNALQAIIQHRESNGLEFSLNYTWAKSMTNNAGGYFGVQGVNGGDSFWQNTYDPAADYGPSNFDVRQNLTGTAIYNLPFGHGQAFGRNWNRLMNEIAGGWELSGDAILYSGLPITITTNPVAADLNQPGLEDFVQRVNQYGPEIHANRGLNHWFGTDPASIPCLTGGQRVLNGTNTPSTCTFGEPATNEFGTEQQNAERAPGYRQIDLSLFKAFPTIKGQEFKFRVDFFNAFNISSYAAPNSNIESSTYGIITGTASPARQIQISGVYEF